MWGQRAEGAARAHSSAKFQGSIASVSVSVKVKGVQVLASSSAWEPVYAIAREHRSADATVTESCNDSTRTYLGGRVHGLKCECESEIE